MSVDGGVVGNDIQIIYELRWKSDIGNRYNTDKVNIMGILDTADTCADWTSFKSYLMQNSGANEDTIIAYVDNDGDEIQINSENYQSTLEYCREKARKHEKVILVLKKPKSTKEHKHRSLHDRMKHHHEKNIGNGRSRHHEFCTRRHVPNRFPFQFMTEYSDSEVEMVHEGGEDEQPPLWFIKYMIGFKKDISDLIMEAMLMMANGELEDKHTIGKITKREAHKMAMENFNPQQSEQVQVVNDKKKTKKKFCDEDSSDCVDGFTLGDRLLKKVHKLQAREKKIERKYEAKIGKLEHKVKRIIDKKTGLRSEKPHTSLGSTVVSKPKKHCMSTQNSAASTTACPSQLPRVSASASGQSIVKVEKPKRCYKSTQNCENGKKIVSFTADKSTTCCEYYAIPDEVVAMNAIPLNRQMNTEFAGRGEIITKRWEVMNNGLSPWTDETELRFTWGSSTLVPLTKVVKVPHLKPGETGIVEVTMQAPDALGRFESYWYFFHSGVRFGHWLGCAYVIGCRMPESAVDLTITKCPRYYEVIAPNYKNNKCSGYHHISATTDDMKMSKSNSTTPIDSSADQNLYTYIKSTMQTKSNEIGDYVAGKPEKYVEEKEAPERETTLNLLMGDNESNAECLKPKSFEQKFNDFVENIQESSCGATNNCMNECFKNDVDDKINNKIVSESVVDDNHDDKTEEDEEDTNLICDSAELNSDSDSDNISVISGTISVGSTDHGDDFVLIPMPELQKTESVMKSQIGIELNVSNENDLKHDENDVTTDTADIERVINLTDVTEVVDKPISYVQSTRCEKKVDKPAGVGRVINSSGVTEVVDKPTSYVQSRTCETKVDKPAIYLQSSVETKVQNPKIEKSPCYVSSTTATNDSETNTDHKITDSTNVCTSTECSCTRRKIDAELYNSRHPFPHCRIDKPNGSRFPPFYDGNQPISPTSPISHPTWRNGTPWHRDDFAPCDQTKTSETVSSFAAPYPGALHTLTTSEIRNSVNYPYPGCPYSNSDSFMNHSHDSNTRHFVFNNSGSGFETYPQQESVNLTCETEQNVECEIRKPARYSYVYSDGRPIPATNISKPDPPQRSTTNFEIPTTTTTSSSTNGVHILPETIVNGAIQVAANAFNTACNVYDMIRGEGENNNNDQRTPSLHNTPIPSPTEQRRMSASSNDTSRSGSGQTNPRSLDNCLHILYEMGFYNRELNIKLLKRYHNDLPTVISKLV